MSVENILQKLQTAPQFHPASADIFGDVTLDAGDVITVSSEGQSYDVPIYHRVMTWRGKPKTMITATGNQQREALPALRRREYAQGSSSYQQGKRLGAGIGGLDSRVSLMENSAVIQNSDSIALAAGKFIVDQDGNLHIINGTGLYLGEGSTSYGVYTEGNLTSGAIIQKINGTSQSGSILANKLDVNATDVAAWGAYTNNTLTGGILVQKINDGSTTTQILGSRVDVKATDLATWGVYTNDTLTAGIIVDKINGGTVTIDAARVNLTGYLTANDITTNMITSKLANATVANMNSLYATTLTAGTNFYMGNSIVTSHGVSFGGGSIKFSYLTTATADATVVASDLPHYHTVSFSNGQFTLGGVTDTAPGPFDVTATTWYANQIAAAKNSVRQTGALSITNSSYYMVNNVPSLSVTVAGKLNNPNETAIGGTVLADATAAYNAGSAKHAETHSHTNAEYDQLATDYDELSDIHDDYVSSHSYTNTQYNNLSSAYSEYVYTHSYTNDQYNSKTTPPTSAIARSVVKEGEGYTVKIRVFYNGTYNDFTDYA